MHEEKDGRAKNGKGALVENLSISELVVGFLKFIFFVFFCIEGAYDTDTSKILACHSVETIG